MIPSRLLYFYTKINLCTKWNNNSYPSPSRVIEVSARTRKTSPTVVFSLQSIPKRQDSSARRPILETTTKYLVRLGCTLSNLTAWKKEDKWLSVTEKTDIQVIVAIRKRETSMKCKGYKLTKYKREKVA